MHGPLRVLQWPHGAVLQGWSWEATHSPATRALKEKPCSRARSTTHGRNRAKPRQSSWELPKSDPSASHYCKCQTLTACPVLGALPALRQPQEHPKRSNQHPKPSAQHPKPSTQQPKPSAQQPKPSAQQPKPWELGWWPPHCSPGSSQVPWQLSRLLSAKRLINEVEKEEEEQAERSVLGDSTARRRRRTLSIDLRICSHQRERNDCPENNWGWEGRGVQLAGQPAPGGCQRQQKPRWCGQEESRAGILPLEPRSRHQRPIHSNLRSKAARRRQREACRAAGRRAGSWEALTASQESPPQGYPLRLHPLPWTPGPSVPQGTTTLPAPGALTQWQACSSPAAAPVEGGGQAGLCGKDIFFFSTLVPSFQAVSARAWLLRLWAGLQEGWGKRVLGSSWPLAPGH